MTMGGDAQPLGQRDRTPQVEVGLASAKLHTQAQRQSQRRHMRTQLGRKLRMTRTPAQVPAHAYLGRTVVVRSKSIHVQRQPRARQNTVIRLLGAQRILVQRCVEVEHHCRARVQTQLAQPGAGRRAIA